jgi:quercetin dioxygenase-like cupin family protein
LHPIPKQISCKLCVGQPSMLCRYRSCQVATTNAGTHSKALSCLAFERDASLNQHYTAKGDSIQSQHALINTAEIPTVDTGHSQIRFLASPDVTGTKSLAFLQGTVLPGGSVHLHSHADPKCFYVLEGEMEAYQELEGSGAWLRVQKGEFAAIHSNAKHAWRNNS